MGASLSLVAAAGIHLEKLWFLFFDGFAFVLAMWLMLSAAYPENFNELALFPKVATVTCGRRPTARWVGSPAHGGIPDEVRVEATERRNSGQWPLVARLEPGPEI